jgi:transcriptional regulator with GAF, ATPase, and Fis domain
VREFDPIIGHSRAIEQAVELASRAAPTDSTILILGETGTGKELFARSIHKLSTRRDEPMISVNCAALPPTLIESELFGHSRGAFTGANATRVGRFEAADGGTLFLDEIGEMSLDLQTKLLRVIQEGAFERLGSNMTITVDVRIIAATNKDLEAAVARGAFRADLFYRLNVVPLTIPPLRDRIEDVPLLANHFAERHSTRLGKPFDSIAPSFLHELMAHDWPGNVRELESVIERSIIVSTSGKLEPVEFSVSSARQAQGKEAGAENTASILDSGLHAAERQHIVYVLRETNWVIEGPDGAAKRLGVAPSTLRSRMKKHGIERPAKTAAGAPNPAHERIH